jgi:hypothetical protein
MLPQAFAEGTDRRGAIREVDRSNDLRVMGATSSFFVTFEYDVSYENTKTYQDFKEIVMFNSVIGDSEQPQCHTNITSSSSATARPC